ncbi:MAG: hypothetical protein NT062_02940 [Proteobacteria bacterium]|nr:hypothetical protein [Pseudomonadota bacterium]
MAEPGREQAQQTLPKRTPGMEESDHTQYIDLLFQRASEAIRVAIRTPIASLPQVVNAALSDARQAIGSLDIAGTSLAPAKLSSTADGLYDGLMKLVAHLGDIYQPTDRVNETLQLLTTSMTRLGWIPPSDAERAPRSKAAEEKGQTTFVDGSLIPSRFDGWGRRAAG